MTQDVDSQYNIQLRLDQNWQTDFNERQRKRKGTYRRNVAGEKHYRQLQKTYGDDLELLESHEEPESKAGRKPIELRPDVAKMIMDDLNNGMKKAVVANKYKLKKRWLWYRIKDGGLADMASKA